MVLIELNETLFDLVLKEVVELQFPAMLVDASLSFILMVFLRKGSRECSKEDATAFSSSFLLSSESFDDKSLPLNHNWLFVCLFHEFIHILLLLELNVSVPKRLSIIVLFDFQRLNVSVLGESLLQFLSLDLFSEIVNKNVCFFVSVSMIEILFHPDCVLDQYLVVESFSSFVSEV